MTINALFTSELQAVDATKSFTEVLDPTYGENEWSVSGWELRAGSSAAMEHAASEALISMGFIWATPIHRYRPASVPSGGATIARKAHDFPYVNLFPSYGFGQITAQVEEWLTLNCLNDTRRPVGHAWGAIHNAIEAEDGFFTANPTYWVAGSPGTFNLDLTGADRIALVNRVAQYCYERLNPQKRISLDPNDGDQWDTDSVCTFVSEVAAQVHFLDGSTDAKFGVYAYAGHRTIPTGAHPHIYVQIALGFNNLGIGYPEMVRLWGEQVHEVALRGYGEIPAQGEYKLNRPFVPDQDDYDLYRAYGANGMNMESNYDFIHDADAVWWTIRYWRDHTITRSTCRQQLVDTFFSGDTKVAEYFDEWSFGVKNTPSEIYRIMTEVVDNMQPENRAIFEPLYALEAQFRRAIDANSSPRTARYYSLLEKALRWTHGLGAIGHISDYGIERQLANANVSTDRPDLMFDVENDWKTSSTVPTNADYVAAKDYFLTNGYRPDFLKVSDVTDVDNYSVVHVTPSNGTWAKMDGATQYFSSENQADYFFLGPGTVTVRRGSGVEDTTTYSKGLHYFAVDSAVDVKWTGGTMFMSLYPISRYEPAAGQAYAYFPHVLNGYYKVIAGARFSFYNGDGSGAREWTSAGYHGGTIVPGVVKVKADTRGFTQLIVMNPFLSSDPAKMLMPKSLAQREFGGRVAITIP